MSSPPLPAAKVAFEFIKMDIPHNTEVLLKTLKHLCTGKIIRCGNKIRVSFYGKMLTVKVCKVIPEIETDISENKTTLTDMVKNLSLSGKQSDYWYKVYDSTKFCISGQKTVDKTEAPFQVRLENVGGYEDIVLQLKDIVNIALSDTTKIPSKLKYDIVIDS